MEIDLRLPSASGEDDKEEIETNGFDSILEVEEKLHNIGVVNCNVIGFEVDSNLEPVSGMEFDSHGEAYAFYQEYARSVGFNTAIQNSRRSKTSREFIDAKFACSRYGTKREYDKSFNRPCSRQGNKPYQENSTGGGGGGRRSCTKTDCKASMHVKKRVDGKWIIHSFLREHNHDLLPAQVVSDQTRRMYAAMARQFAEYRNVIGLKNQTRHSSDKCTGLPIEPGDGRALLEFFTHMQTINSNFFYSIDLNDDLRLKNVFWVDAKSRHDYADFSDVVSFDISYIKNRYKTPLALFVGVNQHYQFILLGCALLSDDSVATYSWIMQTWLRAVGGLSPTVIITERDVALTSAVSDFFPNSHHSFFLWNIWGKIIENLSHVIKLNENFIPEMENCIHRSWSREDFENRWWEIVEMFGLRGCEWLEGIFEERGKWAPAYMKGWFLAGMSGQSRSDSVNSHFDRYLQKKSTVTELLKQYDSILHDRYEEKTKADSDTWNRHPVLKSPSPLEKHVANLYTHAVFKRFQVEVLGAVACHPKRESQEGTTTLFKVQDFEKNQEFVVTWEDLKSEVSCICRLFEYRGLVCRHAMIVLQICGHGEVPSQYILRRWTKDAQSRYLVDEGCTQLHQSRVQRYNDLCRRAVRLGEEASLSQDSYAVALSALEETYGNCVGVNNSSKNGVNPSVNHAVLCVEEDNRCRNSSKMCRKKNQTKKKKVNSESDVVSICVQESMHEMDKVNSRGITLDGYYGAQQSVQGMVQLNLMAPTRDHYYTGQQAIQGLGQLSSIAPSHHYYGAPQAMTGLSQMDFFRTAGGFPYGLREEPNVRSSGLHDDVSRHP